MKINYFGHSFFGITSGDTRILIDPFINRSCQKPEFKTLTKCPCNEKSIKGVSLILISHEHFDHFDQKAIESIASRDSSCVIGHESVLKKLSLSKNLLRPIVAGEEIKVRGVNIEALPVHHPNSFYPLSYMLSLEDRKVFHSGDTALMDSFDKLRPDVAMLPIGGTFTMDLIDAVRATKMMKPRHVIPMHYDTFELIKADPNEFKQRIDKSILKTKPVILKPGESFNL